MEKKDFNINKLGWSLWYRYLVIAQEFWLKTKKSSALLFVLLVTLMTLTAAAIIGVFTYSVVHGVYSYFPEFVNKNAPGFHDWLVKIWDTLNFKYVFISIIALFSCVMFLNRKKIKGKYYSWLMLGGLMLFMLAISGLQVIISYVSRFYWTALSQKDSPTFFKNILIYFLILMILIPVVAIYPWMRKTLAYKWRTYITENLVTKYLKNRAYYKLNNKAEFDNPDQRISEDISYYTANSLTLILIIFGNVVDIIAFTGVLYSISKLLSGVLIIYAVVGTLGTVLIGKRLVGLNFLQLRKEADFRYGLIHVRDNAEQIAFYNGEEREKDSLFSRFKILIKNYRGLIGWQRNLDFFTNGYRYIIALLPIVILAPMFFKDQIEFGMIQQGAYAFSIVLASLSFIVDQFDAIASFAASINRIEIFDNEVISAGKYSIIRDQNGKLLEIKRKGGKNISCKKLTLNTPNLAQKLFENLDLSVKKGSSLLLVGPSGVGKSSMLRALGGLWNSGTGEVTFPEDKVFFIPQKPYMILGSLRDQLLYPGWNPDVSDEQLEKYLIEVNLPDLTQKIKESHSDVENPFEVIEKWEDVLSLGEQQRLAFARLLINRPDYAILDESTSSLDAKNEEKLYKKMKEMGVTIVSVGHRESIRKYHDQILELKTDGSWKMLKK